MHTKLSLIVLTAIVLAGSLVACDKGKDTDSGPTVHAPKLDGTMLPAGLEALVLGKATVAEVTAALSQPTKQIADRSLGGDQTAMDDDRPVVIATWRSGASILAEAARDGFSEEMAQAQLAANPNLLPADGPLAALDTIKLKFAKVGDGEPVLISIELTGAAEPKNDLCGFIKGSIGADKEALNCPAGSHRGKARDEGEDILYCAGDAAGEHNVFVECRPGRLKQGLLEYSLSLD